MTKRIDVSIANQTLKAFDGDKLVFSFDCITGSDGHQTDPGRFRIMRKDAKHVSTKYHVKMYYAMFFTDDGKAIHQYHGPGPFALIRTLKQDVSGWFGSHGCVRLKEEDAGQLYQWTPLHTAVDIQ